MTVKQLINKLKKMPPDLEVVFQDHDSDEYTVSSFPKTVSLLDFDEIPENQKNENIWKIKGEIVSIRG